MRSNVDPENAKKVLELFRRDKVQFVNKHPFWGLHLLPVECIPANNEVKVAAVRGTKELYLNACPVDPEVGNVPYWSLPEKGRFTLIAHQIAHIVCGHVFTVKKGGYDRRIASLAQDAVINRCLSQTPEFDINLLPAGVKSMANKTGFTVTESNGAVRDFPIANFSNIDWIPMYWHILDQVPRMPPLALDHAMFEDVLPSDSTEEEEIEHDMAVQSSLERMRGNLPLGLPLDIRMPEKARKSDWVKRLRRFIQIAVTNTNWSTRYNTRKMHIALIKKLEGEEVPDIVVALDSSGSMYSSDVLGKGLSEFKQIRMAARSTLHFISCDAKVHEFDTYPPERAIDWDNLKVSGGGGTNFIPVFETVEKDLIKKGKTPKLLVFFTDGFGTFPTTKPRYPVIWVTIGLEPERYPFGTVIDARLK